LRSPSVAHTKNPRQRLTIGTGVGLIEWSAPGKLGGKCERVEVGGVVADVCASDVQEALFAVATSSGVCTPKSETDCRVKSL
jgi:hypothetical protein